MYLDWCSSDTNCYHGRLPTVVPVKQILQSLQTSDWRLSTSVCLCKANCYHGRSNRLCKANCYRGRSNRLCKANCYRGRSNRLCKANCYRERSDCLRKPNPHNCRSTYSQTGFSVKQNIIMWDLTFLRLLSL